MSLRTLAKGGKKIWIDLDNSPHVPFFIPIQKALEERGHSVFFTSRDCFQVCSLADYHGLRHTRIGRHYGAKKLFKILGTLWRAVQLAPLVLRQRPDVSMSHGSRGSIVLSSLLRIPTVLFFDYEYARIVPGLEPTFSIAPEVVARDARSTVRGYRGLKEDVYVRSFTPDASILDVLRIPKDRIIATIRPPASEAHYHNPASDRLFVETVELLGRRTDVCMVILPRNEKTQRDLVYRTWPDWCRQRRIIVPDHAVDGLNLIWHSDLVVSGGGTMNREAAALGVPVYSIFRGQIGAVDHYLAEAGRLTLLSSVEDVQSRIRPVKRNRLDHPGAGDGAALKDIMAALDDWIGVPARPTIPVGQTWHSDRRAA